MCGIVGYCGNKQAAPILLEGLKKLEYRGYDSAGIAVRNGEDKVRIVKAKGRLAELANKTDDGKAMKGSCGIGHTRWATHGEPSENNAHPHHSDDYEVVGVHNGIIENYTEIKDKLLKKNYSFYSETDTEAVIKLIDYYYKKYNIGPVDALAKTMVRVRGSYALAVMFKDYPGEIWVARKDSPMIIGVDAKASYIASDVPAILKYTRDVYYIGNLEMACLKNNEVKKDDAETQEKQMNLAELYKDKVLDLIEQVSKKQDSGNHNQTRILQKLDTLDSRTDGIESRLGDVVVYLNGDFQDFLKRQHKPRKHPNPELHKTVKPTKEDVKAIKG